MGLLRSEITFDNPYKTYYAGQTINGRVDFTFDAPKKIRGIIFKATGKARTSWKEKHGKTTTHYSDKEKYFKIEYSLLGNQTDEIILPAGQQSYSFTCVLPQSLPSSFEGIHGSIRYTIKITIDRPWKFDHVEKSAFTVISNLDLNLDPHLKNPVAVRNEKLFWSLSCTTRPLAVTVSLPFAGYVSGQMIPFTVKVNNGAYITVNAVKIDLVKVVTYFAIKRRKRKTVKTDILNGVVAIAPIYQGQTKTGSQQIQIPVLPPSDLKNCTIIDLEYQLKVTCNVSGLHMNHKVKVPITIGTIPLLAMQSSIVPNNASDSFAGMVGWNTSAESSTHYAELPPPTYEESQFGTFSIAGKTDNKDNKCNLFSNEQQHFSPRYPVYSFPASAPPM